MKNNSSQYRTGPRLTRQQLLDRWGLKASATLRRYELAGKLHSIRISPRVILYTLEEVEQFERLSHTSPQQAAGRGIA